MSSAPPPPPPRGVRRAGRCGMCGSCGSMPPWAPEMLQDATPAARRALFQRMKEKQRRFIVERDARLAAMGIGLPSNVVGQHAPLPPADEIPLRVEKLQTEKLSPVDVHAELCETSNEPRSAPVAVGSRQAPASPPASPIEFTSSPKRKPSRRAVVIDPYPERTAERASMPNISSASLRSNDSDVDSFHTAEEDDHHVHELGAASLDEIEIDDDALQEASGEGFDGEREAAGLDEIRVDDDGLQEVPVEDGDGERDAGGLDRIEADDDGLREVPMEDGDSEGDAGGLDQTEADDDGLQEVPMDDGDREGDACGLDQVEADDDGLQEVPMEDGDGEGEVDEFADWQAFDADKPISTGVDGDSSKAAVPRGETTKQDEEGKTEVSLEDEAANNSEYSERDASSDPIPTMTMLQLSPGKSIASIPSENLEETVSARRPLARGHSRQGSSSHFEEYALPPEIVPLQSADVPTPLQCEDCVKWRNRVEELQLKIEALTSTLAARDMECASLRAKVVGKVRGPNRNESRLIQECESLRVTTEFLYQKLERYERKAHIGHGDVH